VFSPRLKRNRKDTRAYSNPANKLGIPALQIYFAIMLYFTSCAKACSGSLLLADDGNPFRDLHSR
jgi:hypothetical protein